MSLMSPALAGGFFTISANWEAHPWASRLIEMTGSGAPVRWAGLPGTQKENESRSVVSDFAAPRAKQSTEFSRPEY